MCYSKNCKKNTANIKSKQQNLTFRKPTETNFRNEYFNNAIITKDLQKPKTKKKKKVNFN